MPIGLIRVDLQIPMSRSLKEKRSRLKPLLIRLRKEFNVATAEIGKLDAWHSAQIGLVTISRDAAHLQRSLQEILRWVEDNWPDLEVEGQEIEII